eukprot:TRINITY_DN13545_c0_g1_i1.p1 TRINITY_DN13545_c0_g1~~TRINITY_DN13545_c0_g1_i1.p1  ORF type:complete len:553 (+),score=136.77 TRINITY_DN13545_c0_g1_i1:158-1660(+)
MGMPGGPPAQPVVLARPPQVAATPLQSAPAPAQAAQGVMEWDPATGQMVPSSLSADDLRELTAGPAAGAGADVPAAAAAGGAAAEQAEAAPPSGDGYFRARPGYNVSGGSSKYVVVDEKPLGVGVFSAVWPVADVDNKLIALKVVRSQDHFRRFAQQEVETLWRMKELADKDPEGSDQVLLLREYFVHSQPTGEEHLCLAFAHLYTNLRNVGRLPFDKGVVFGKQLMYALRYLHETVGLVHCDVKPDNLLLRHDEKAVKLCDFGAARMTTAPDLQAVDELQPMFYRAPEVFLGAPRGRKIDIWSAGCTIYEMVVGRILFKSCLTPREVLENMMRLRGRVPASVIEQGRLAPHFFVKDRGFQREGGGIPVELSTFRRQPMLDAIAPHVDFGKASGAKSAQEQAKDQLSRLIGSTCVVAAAGKKRKTGPTEGERRMKLLADFLESCLDIDPATRGSAAQLCGHAAFEKVELPPAAELQEAPPLPEEAPPPLPPTEPPPPASA